MILVSKGRPAWSHTPSARFASSLEISGAAREEDVRGAARNQRPRGNMARVLVALNNGLGEGQVFLLRSVRALTLASGHPPAPGTSIQVQGGEVGVVWTCTRSSCVSSTDRAGGRGSFICPRSSCPLIVASSASDSALCAAHKRTPSALERSNDFNRRPSSHRLGGAPRGSTMRVHKPLPRGKSGQGPTSPSQQRCSCP